MPNDIPFIGADQITEDETVYLSMTGQLVKEQVGVVEEIRKARYRAGYGKVPEHASIARRQQGIFLGRREKYMENLFWKYERKDFLI